MLTAACSYADIDTTRLGLGARSVSLGRCSVALFDDINSMFVNPASSSYLETYNLSSMYVSLSEDISYTQLGAALPTDQGSFGLSYLGSFSGGLVITTTEAERIISTGASFDFSDALLSLIYGRRFREDLSLGLALKFFHQDFSQFGSGQGFDLGLGLLWQPDDKLKIGLVQQNTLPYSMGGKMEWSTGHSEGIPFYTKAGFSYKLMDNLLWLTDLDYARNRPLLAHLGTEWTPTELFALRGGVDQYAESETSAITSYTLGIGLNVNIFRFDYAYYYDTLLDHNNAHFFSLRIVPKVEEEKPVVEEPKKPILWLKTFKDVTYPEFGRKEIEHLATLDIITGYPDATFRPKRDLSRAELVTLLARATATEGAFSELDYEVFKDVSPKHWAKKYIEYGVQKRWVKGFPDGTFKPNDKLTRAQAITVFSRFNQLMSETPIIVDLYKDVPSTHWAFKDVTLAKDAGWLDYIQGNYFYPNAICSRAEASYILFRTSFARAKVEEMYQKYDVRRPDVP